MEGRYSKISAIAAIVSAIVAAVTFYRDTITEVERTDIESDTKSTTEIVSDQFDKIIDANNLSRNNTDIKKLKCNKKDPPVSCLFRRDIK